MDRLLSSLCDYVIKPTLTFVFNQLSSSSTEFLSQFSANQVTLLMKFLTALFDFHYCVKKQRDLVMRLSDNDRATFVAGLFAVAYVWAFASNLQQRFATEIFDMCCLCILLLTAILPNLMSLLEKHLQTAQFLLIFLNQGQCLIITLT